MEFAIELLTKDKPGVLKELTTVISANNANITYVDIAARRNNKAKIYFELENGNKEKIIRELEKLDVVFMLKTVSSFSQIYGKRVIIIGGGIQVAEVAKGAIAEADRHNIRGEKISVDTIPLVGEQDIEKAVKAVARLPRAKTLVLAGSLMGGSISSAVREIREQGIIVISLNMAGSVPENVDLVVSDPTQAGVMAVMAIADTAHFDINKLKNKKF